MEHVLSRAYRGGRFGFPQAWPAKLAHASGLVEYVRPIHHRVTASNKTPLRIAFASDFHAGPTTHPSVLDAAVDAIVNAKPDVVLLGGDYVLFSSDHIDALASRLARLAEVPLGVHAVLGNHDLWADDRVIAAALRRAGVSVLVNERRRLPAPYDDIALHGLDDPWTGSFHSRALARSESDSTITTNIVLVHAPEAMPLLRYHAFDLAVCGHTHGGHIALPGGVPIVAPGPQSRVYAHGRFDLDDGPSHKPKRTLLVSRGVGSSELPFRWNATPDVLVIDVACANVQSNLQSPIDNR